MALTLAEILAISIVATLWNILLFVILVRGSPPRPKKKGEPLSICFLHPDLGLGGAEMLVVEMAVALAKKGHHVEVFTSFHDKKRAFTETTDGTLDIHVHDSILPRSIFGRFVLPLAHCRFFWTSAKLMMRHKNLSGGYDVIFVDQISSTIPLLKFSGAKVVYYCHFPDLLLSPKGGPIKKLYRLPLDLLEELTTDTADTVLVNSNFTAGVYKSTFKRIQRQPIVLYPTVHVERIKNISLPSTPLLKPTNSLPIITAHTNCLPLPDDGSSSTNISTLAHERSTSLSELPSSPSHSPAPPVHSWSSVIDGQESATVAEITKTNYLLSINRYERKKNLGLAIDAFATVLYELDSKEKSNIKLVIAGGYDERLDENVKYLAELKQKVVKLKLENFVHFFIKLPDVERNLLLWNCKMVLYTPENEHFGIVPLEAGVALKPVIACNSGGPLESIIDGVTGFHVAPNPDLWAEKILLLLRDGQRAQTMGENAVKRVVTNFAPNAIILKLEDILYNITSSKTSSHS